MQLDQFATAMVALGALAAVVAIYRGNSTAMALLASAIVSSFYCELVEHGFAPFHVAVLLAVDFLIIVWIIVGWANEVIHKRYGRRRDVIILALFLAIWPFYFDDRPVASAIIDIIVSAQMLMCFPVHKFLGTTRGFLRRFTDDDQGMNLVLPERVGL